MSKTIHINLVSDFACPWCFVGKRRLQKAIELRPELDIALTWQPFQLNPDMPREGRNPVLVAIDTPDLDRAKALAQSLAGAVGGIIVDVRTMPPEVQAEAWRRGLIPDHPARQGDE